MKARQLRGGPMGYRRERIETRSGSDERRPAPISGPGERTQLSRSRALRRHSLISPAQMGHANRGRVIQALFDLGPTSRAELARVIGVNRATITGIVQPLIDRSE